MKTIRRKLQFAGNSSYVLTLPKDWIVAKGLDNQKDRSEVLIEEVQGNLRVSPAGVEGKREPTIHSIVVGDKSSEEIVRLLLAAYLASKNQIIVKTKDGEPLSFEVISAVNRTVGKLWGSEIVSESPDSIIINDALDPSSMGVKDIINRGWFTAQNMLEHAVTGLFEQDKQAVDRVTNFEETLDRLYYLALRQLYKASSNSIFANDIGIKPSQIINYHLLLKNIERIGDHAYQIIHNIDKAASFKNKEELLEISKMAQGACGKAIDAFIRSEEHPNDPIPLMIDVQNAINEKREVNRRAETIDLDESEFALSRSLLRITDYASDIGELVLNRIVARTDEEP